MLISFHIFCCLMLKCVHFFVVNGLFQILLDVFGGIGMEDSASGSNQVPWHALYSSVS